MFAVNPPIGKPANGAGADKLFAEILPPDKDDCDDRTKARVAARDFGEGGSGSVANCISFCNSSTKCVKNSCASCC
jgi:hypothetical protein